jgi:hypothetical protein
MLHGGSPLLWWLALCFVGAGVGADSFVLGSLARDNSSLVLRSQRNGSPDTEVVFRCTECIITDVWSDEVTHHTFYATRSLDGTAGAISMGNTFRCGDLLVRSHIPSPLVIGLLFPSCRIGSHDPPILSHTQPLFIITGGFTVVRLLVPFME